jgi:O-antigen ligase
MDQATRGKIFGFFLLAFVFCIPLSETVSIRLLIATVILSLVLISNPSWRYDLLSCAWDVILYFLVLCVGVLYSDDFSNAMGVLERNLSFIVLPLVFCRIRIFDKQMFHRICLVFTAGVIVASGICLGYAIWRDTTMNFQGAYYYSEFTDIIDSHPTYMAYYVCFSIIFLLYLISFELLNRFQQSMVILSILFLASILMLTAGRSTFASMLMMASFFFLKMLFETHTIKRKMLGISVSILLLAILLLQSPYSQRVFPKFLEGRSLSLSKVKGDSWERLVLWEAALKASDNVVFGVGTGDYSMVMNNYYRDNQLSEYADVNFNAHNQFIQVLFSNGLLGLTALLIIIMRPIFLLTRRQNIFGMLAFFPFLIYGISEVFLGRYQGIVFFVLLHQLFTKFLLHNTPRFSLKQL